MEAKWPLFQREYGRAFLHLVEKECPLFYGVNDESQVWMSHSDTVVAIPDGFHITAKRLLLMWQPTAVMKGATPPLHPVSPEVTHTSEGLTMLEEFCCAHFRL